MKKYSILTLIVLTTLLGVSSCVKKDFDEPPYSGDIDPNIPVTTSIKDLKDRYDATRFGRTPLPIGDDAVIYGYVTANDISGNFYKQLMIQDSTGALAVNIDKRALYTDFPVGRKVYIKCKGLALSDYGQFKQLGVIDATGELGSIPGPFLNDYVVQASYPNTIEPVKVTVGNINTVLNNEDMVGMLIQFDRVQFESGELMNTYANPSSAGSGTNRTIEDCGGATILLRNSNYAQFQSAPIPQGSGKLTAIYSRYNNDAQLLIRSLDDVDFNQDRCPFGLPSDTLMSIGDLRAMYTGTPKLVTNRKIRGVVISDGDDVLGNNITSKNLVVQDGDKGIVVRFASSQDNSYALGDSLEIIISGHTLSEFGRLLQIGDQVTASDVQILGTGNVTPRVATIQDIITNFEAWESTLVTIKNANFVSASNSSGHYQGTVLLNDGSTATDFPLFTQSYAKFSSVPAPVGQTKEVTGFLYSITSTDRISIRRLTDITP